ncbi:hypothetical protein EHM92_06800, partial [bacterium]
ILPAGFAGEPERIVDLTTRHTPEGQLVWDVPEGRWSILRFGRTTTGANTRPAPLPGLGLECDKLDTAALNAHFDDFVGALLRELGPLEPTRKAGWTMLHIDSWEMGSQNWSTVFRQEFRRRRGYDLLPYLPVVTGRIVKSREISERFLWDIRQTANELVLENHAMHLKELGARHGFGLSIEPYDMTPCADMSLGSIADVPMSEFWLYGFNTSYSVIEATSIAHTCGRPIVAAEAFTSSDEERWQAYPGSMKALGDWAFCAGINRFAFHRYQHQFWPGVRPGMTMGPYGVHWERTQTWWDMVPAYHGYLSRCQFMLRRGLPVADICYLVAEGAPQVFRPPSSAVRVSPQSPAQPDRLGHNFDGIAPDVFLARMSVRDGRLALPDGMSYRVLALPERETMTPPLLRKIKSLVEAGATVIGPRPRKSPSLSGYPECDKEVQELAGELWGNMDGLEITEHRFGAGRVLWRRPAVTQLNAGAEETAALKRASWIWHREDMNNSSARSTMRYFRRDFSIRKNQQVQSAYAHITADHAFTLYVNGQNAGRGEDSTAIYSFDVGYLLKAGLNRVALQLENVLTPPFPAGALASITIRFHNGRTVEVPSDGKWTASRSAGPGWATAADPSKGWRAVRVFGPFDSQPWKSRAKQAFVPEQYGDFAAIRDVLSEMNVLPDFESDAPLRYTHRKDGNRDIYFIANRDARPLSATCTFRVSGKQPELWDAVRGEIRQLSEYTQKEGRTSLTLHFAPNQSFFIVYSERADTTKTHAPNFSAMREIGSVSGAWDVSFDPTWGGPKNIKFARLEDWTQRKEAGIKYYSGSATYAKSFDLPLPETAGTGKADVSP